MTITLFAPCRYNSNYPPKNAAKAYVARITGRSSGPVKYAREFLGNSFDAVDEDDAGLYEVQYAEKKGGWTRYYYVVLSHPEHGLIRSIDCETLLPKIAKALDDGRHITDIVSFDEVAAPDPGSDAPAKFVPVLLTRAQAAKLAASADAADAEAQVRLAVSALSPADASKLLRRLAKALTAEATSSE